MRYELDTVYVTQGGEEVVFVTVANRGKEYETMACAKGVHRYTRRKADLGRVTGSPFDRTHPGNVPPIQHALGLFGMLK
jgi:hypothetical protein